MIKFKVVKARQDGVWVHYMDDAGTVLSEQFVEAKDFIDTDGEPSRERLMQRCLVTAKNMARDMRPVPPMLDKLSALVDVGGDSAMAYISLPDHNKIVSTEKKADII